MKQTKTKPENPLDFLESIIDSSPISIIACTKTGEIALWNKAAEKTFGWKKEEVIGKANPLISEEHVVEFKDNFDKALLGSGLISLRTTRKHKDGSLIDVSISANVWKDQEGNIIGAIAQIVDITDKVANEKRVEESETRYLGLFESIRDAILIADTDRNIINCNPAFTEIFGYSLEDLKGKKTITLYENEEQFLELGKALKENYGGKSFLYTVNYRRKNGTSFPGETAVFYLKDSDGGTTGFIALIRDISDRIKGETALKESEERFRNIFEENFAPMLLLDPDTRNIVDVNSAAVKFYGWSREELLKMKIDEINTLSADGIIKEMEDAKKLNRMYFNFEHRRADGSIRDVEVFGSKIKLKNKEYLHSIVHDITERRRAEAQLNQFNINWQQLTEATQQINTVLELPAVMRQLVASARELTGAKEGTAGLLVDGKMVFTEYNQHGNVFPIDYSFVENYGVPGWVMATRRPYISNDAEHDVHVIPEIQKALGFYNLADTPILNKHGEIIGCFEMHNKPENFDEHDIMLLQNLSAGAAIAIENSQMIIQRQQAEKAERESKEKLFVTLRSIGDGVIATDVDGNVVLMNPVAEKLCGWNFNDAEGKPLTDVFKIVNAGTRETVENPVKLVMKNGNRIGLANHTVLISKDGKEYQIADSAAPIKDNNGKIIGVVLVFTDVTEDYTIREALTESEERYRSIAQSANDAIVTANEEGIILGWNSASEKIFGYSEEEVHNQPLTIIIPHQYREKHLAGVRRASEGSEHKVLGKTIEAEGLRKNGQVFPLELSLAGWESSGKIFYTGIMRDITERKRTEQNIKKLSRGIEQSPASIVITDDNGNIEYVNRKFTEVTGYSFSEAIGKNPKILKSEHSNIKIYQDLWLTIKSGKEWRGEFCNKKKNGELYWESASISPIINSKGDITNFIAVKEDITEQKKINQELIKAKESAEKADKMKSEFLAQMSHEIRTPLNVIQSYTRFLEDDFGLMINENQQFIFKGIKNASKRIIRTIELILNLSELEVHAYANNPQKVDVYNDITVKIFSELKLYAQSKGLDWRIKTLTEETVITVDEYAVSQILINLVDNAIKYTDKGFIELRVLRNDKNLLQIEVEDSGVGISEEYMDKLFTPFSQEETGYSRKYEGNGLGMSLVKKYCELINADVNARSEKNVGTIFTVVINSTD